ncbi:MAG: hypothetical protein V7L20_19195 [Nostoc sp.]|uniref:hypothetical protein n=1 Tax=Nostoc sp. TaxID=1180 RepID=UPI002FF4B6ED
MSNSLFLAYLVNQRCKRVSHRKRLVLAQRKAFGMALLKAMKERHPKGSSFNILCIFIKNWY